MIGYYARNGKQNLRTYADIMCVMDKSKKMKELALALKQYQQETGVSNRGLANTIGCSEGTIRNYLKAKGNPEDATLYKIKRKLGIAIEGLTPAHDPDRD